MESKRANGQDLPIWEAKGVMLLVLFFFVVILSVFPIMTATPLLPLSLSITPISAPPSFLYHMHSHDHIHTATPRAFVIGFLSFKQTLGPQTKEHWLLFQGTVFVLFCLLSNI